MSSPRVETQDTPKSALGRSKQEDLSISGAATQLAIWHYLIMTTWRSRLAKLVGLGLLSFALVAPASAVEINPPAYSGVANSGSNTPSPETSEVGETPQRPNVGDDAPGGHELGEERNVLTDETGLIALGLAALIGAATAILVMRARRKSSLY